ncbi:S8 family serine peptidase [Pyxidicoccus trucidator]|uniref:S8 family serine peptidase n=1 Tax=Pyxidicoccus trucidator TaxID=2709662 RepID=UPI0013D8FC0D|nr:S8 family serine peptidase [Pyxidicoccus trucidator]
MNVLRRSIRPADVTRPAAPLSAARAAARPSPPTGRGQVALADARYRSSFEAGDRRLGKVLDGPNTARAEGSRSARSQEAVAKTAGRSSRTADDTVALFDDFGPGNTHGDKVRYVVRANSPSTRASGIRQVEVGTSGRGPLNQVIEQSVSGFLDSTANAIQSVLSNPGKIRVINQSQGLSEVDMATQVFVQARAQPGGLQYLAREMGLPENASNKALLKALVARVDRIFETSPRILQAKARYNTMSDKLERKGILHVVAAGNEGATLKELRKLGIRGDRDFARSVLFNRNTVVVGASTGAQPDGIAGFSTPSPFVTVAIDGTDIRVAGNNRSADGTSFAAPQVTATIAEMRRINPRLTNAQVRSLLKRAATDTSAPRILEGAGILNPDRAKELARQSLSQNVPGRVS